MTTRALELISSQVPAPRRLRAAGRWVLGALVIAIAFFVYWRESWSVMANSDSAAAVLQASDMLHGNWLLHGWRVSDVSFYTTELPQYVLVTAVLGVGAAVVHVAAAMSYTLIVVLAALLAKGRARGAEGLVRALLAAGIVASPQFSGALIMLLGPDHTGTMVPVLATWLVIDRVPADFRGARWFMPPAVCLLLALTMTADTVVLLSAIGPLVITVMVRAGRAAVRRGDRLASKSYELSLAAAAVVAAGLGWLAPRVIKAMGGYQVWHLNTRFVPLGELRRGVWNTIQAVLQLFGADPIGSDAFSRKAFGVSAFGTHPAVELTIVWLHLAGVILAVLGLCIALARFFREDGILLPALAVAILLQLAAFLVSIHSTNLMSVREIVAVMPFGAVLAGRTLAAPLLRMRLVPKFKYWLLPVAVVVTAGYLAGLGYGAAQPSVPSANQGLADWLTAHHLSYGLAGYWQAGSVTLDTGGRVQVAGIVAGNGGVGPYYWETGNSAYDPSLHDATFVVADGPTFDGPVRGLQAAAENTFGRPRRIYHALHYTIMVWDYNLLKRLP